MCELDNYTIEEGFLQVADANFSAKKSVLHTCVRRRTV